MRTNASYPAARSPSAGTLDLRGGRTVAELDIDVAYTDLAFDGGVARQTLQASDGRSVSLWQDESCGYVHVFVTDKFPGRPKAVAIEPMTGPANAFNSGDGLRWLAAGGVLHHDLGHQRVPVVRCFHYRVCSAGPGGWWPWRFPIRAQLGKY